LSRAADTAARKPLKRLTIARSARNTPLKQGVNEAQGHGVTEGEINTMSTTAGTFFGWLRRASWQASLLMEIILSAQRAFERKLNTRRRYAFWVLALALGLITLTDAGNKAVAADAGPASQLSGTVVDEQGRPVADATVDCYHYPARPGYLDGEPELEQRAVTDSNGAFTISSSAGKTLVVVRKAGLATGWKTWNPFLGDSSEPLVLTAPTALAGVVVDENQQPVAGAEVWVSGASFGDEYARAAHRNDLFGQPARECFSARTTADGRFRIENFPAYGRAALDVRKTAKAQRPSGNGHEGRWNYQSGEQDIELMLGPPGAIEGRVVVAETGQPLGGVRVIFQPTGGELHSYDCRESVESSTDGAFRVPDVPSGMYRVRAMGAAPGQPVPDWMLASENSLVTVVAGETTRDVLVHASEGALVEVTVIARNDLKPLANVAVWSGLLSGGSAAYTGTNGAALLRVPPWERWFSVFKKDWVLQDSTAEVEAGRTNHVRFELTPAPRIAGTVRDPGGAPAAGVLVSFHPGHYPEAYHYVECRTDDHGRYEMTMNREPGDRGAAWAGPMNLRNFIMASSLERNLAAIQEFYLPTNFKRLRARIPEEDGAIPEFYMIPTNLDLSLQPGITLSGFVKDTEGAPVTSAMVELSIRSGLFVPKLYPRPTHVDADGSYAFPALPQGRRYLIFGAAARAYGTAHGEIKAEDTKTDRYEFPTFVLKWADRKLAGQVLGPYGKPVAGATVMLTGEGQHQGPQQWNSTKTDGKGHFVFDAVCEGQVYLFIRGGTPPGESHGFALPRFEAQAGDTNVVAQLDSE
jgi:hypothetical protein